MLISRSLRQRAEECLRLASDESDAWVKTALKTLGLEMLEVAEELESAAAASKTIGRRGASQKR